MMTIVETTVRAPIETVWQYWTAPEHITHWAFASDDWEVPEAANDLQEGGTFLTRMQAKDGSTGFDFTGTYTLVSPPERIEYDMSDGRHAVIEFRTVPEGTLVTESFDPEHENSDEKQRAGWQAILENFRAYTESQVEPTGIWT
jgi:uncharacterized protein YndB with AHSA1/START domain